MNDQFLAKLSSKLIELLPSAKRELPVALDESKQEIQKR
jgi:hypothetical protein